MDLKTILEKENHSVDTVLYGVPFNISSERNIYNFIRNKYKNLALKAGDKFVNFFKEFKDIEDLIENAPSAFIVACEDSILEVIRDIISIDIYTVDKEIIVEKAFEGKYFDAFSIAYAKYSQKYDKIVSELAGAESARERRKQNRPRWQSTTIGGNAIDAWSNQLDAAAMNATEGIAHSVVNAIGNAIDRSEAKSNLKQLFDSSVLKSEMVDSVYDSCFNIHFLLIELIGQNSDIHIKGLVTKQDRQKAKVMFNNLTAIELDDEKRVQFINEILKLNPYEYSFYKTFVAKFGDKDNSLGEFSEYHGINRVLLKNVILVEYVKKNLGTTEEDAHQCQILMINRAEEIGLEKNNITTAQSVIDEQLKALDLVYRTVDGILFETRDRADLAKEELIKIQAIMDTIKPPTENSTLSYEKDLIEKGHEIEKFETAVKNKYIKQINAHLKNFDKKFCKEGIFSAGMTREEAGKARASLVNI